jgi:arginase family enzyme
MIIVSVPGIHAFGKTKGSEKAPGRIIDYIKCEKKCKNLKFVEFNLEMEDLEYNQKTIFLESMKIFKENKDNDEKILFIGGDHSISFPLFNSFRQVYKNPFLLDLDAHFDIMPPFREVSHEEWVQALIDQGFDTKNMLMIGARRLYPEEEENFEKSKIKVIKISEFDDFLKNPSNFKLDDNDAIYLSLDLDVLDEKFFSATGYPTIGGLNPEQLKKFLNKILRLKNFKAMDLVEYNPEKDLNGKTMRIVIDIVNEIIKEEQ